MIAVHASRDSVAGSKLTIEERLEITNSHVAKLEEVVDSQKMVVAALQDQINDLNNLIKDLQPHEEVPPKSHEGNRGQSGEVR